MYIEQSIDALLFEWKNSKSLKPLLLRGAHQVGKKRVMTALQHINYNNNKPIGRINTH
jgi:hypothetical protein